MQISNFGLEIGPEVEMSPILCMRSKKIGSKVAQRVVKLAETTSYRKRATYNFADKVVVLCYVQRSGLVDNKTRVSTDGPILFFKRQILM